jgi:hypothetical protein
LWLTCCPWDRSSQYALRQPHRRCSPAIWRNLIRIVSSTGWESVAGVAAWIGAGQPPRARRWDTRNRCCAARNQGDLSVRC